MQKTGKTVQIHSFNEIQNISGHLTDSIRKKEGIQTIIQLRQGTNT